MREIVCRGKRKDNGEWIYGFYAYKHDGDRHFILKETIADVGPSYFTDYEVFAESVGQHTQLINKKGREIHEGDILYYKLTDVYSRVEYEKGAFWAGEAPLIDCLEEDVVGNVFDNPELLEV